MLSEYEAEKIKRDMRHELEGSGRAAVAKCAAGLAIVALIAAIGAGAPPASSMEVATAADAAAGYTVTLSRQ